MTTRLMRSRTDHMIAGVCGGLGQYLNIDPTIVRIFFVLLAFGDGIGVLIYLLLWFILPLENQVQSQVWDAQTGLRPGDVGVRAREMGQEFAESVRTPNPKAGMIIGIALIVLGLVYLLQNLNITWLAWLRFDILWPLILIVGGLILLFRLFRGTK